jgi:hypothetical protein
VKGVHFLGFCRLRGRERLLVGIVAKIMNYEIIMHVLGERVPMYLWFMGWRAYVYGSSPLEICDLLLSYHMKTCGSQLMDDMEISSTYEIMPHGSILLVTHGVFSLVTCG